MRAMRILRNMSAPTIGLIVFVILAAIAFSGPLTGHGSPESFAKSYTLTLTDMNGKPVRLSDFKNKLVIAYAWASWCPYCAHELQNLSKLRSTYGDKVQVVAINRAEPAPIAQAYVSGLTNVQGIVFLLDPSDSFFKSIGGYAMPETEFIQQDGTVVYHQHGPLSHDDASQEVQKLVGQ